MATAISLDWNTCLSIRRITKTACISPRCMNPYDALSTAIVHPTDIGAQATVLAELMKCAGLLLMMLSAEDENSNSERKSTL